MGACIAGAQTNIEQSSSWETTIFFAPWSRGGKVDGQVIGDTTIDPFLTVVNRATMALDSDGFTLTFAFRIAALDFNWVAIGGDEVSVAMGENNAPTSPGQQTVTGLSFQPALLLLTNGFSGSSANGTWFGNGWVDTYGRQGVTAVHNVGTGSTAMTGDTDTYQRTNKCLVVLDDVTGSLQGEAQHVSHNADGFTINWTDAPSFAAPFFWIAVGGLTSHAGSLTQPTSTGVQTAVALNCKPEVVFFQTNCKVSSAVVVDEFRYTLGFATETDQGCVWGGDDDGISSSAGRRNTSGHWNDRCIVAAHPTGTSSATIDASATLTDLRPDSFEITWGTVDLVSRQVLYVAIGQPLNAEEPGPPDYDIIIGEETGINPLLETFRIQETLDGNTTVVMDIDSSGSPLTRFTLNDNVIVTNNDIRIFGGVVTGLRERAFGGVNGGAIVVEVQATSYAINAKRRYLTQSDLATAPTTLGTWLTNLITTHLGAVGITLHPDQTDGPTLEALLFERTLISEAIDQVAESIGYLWSIDFYNRLRVWAPGDVLAPADIDEATTDVLTGDVEKEEQLAEGYANYVTLVGEGILIPDWLDEFVGGGSPPTDIFDLTYKVAGPYPYTPDGQGAVAFGVVRYTDGSTESIGGLNAPIGYIWEYDPVNLTIRRRSGPVAPGVDFEFPYHALFEPNAVAFDAGEIATYGLWEHVEAVDAVPDELSAQQLADAILAKKLASKDQFVTYQTRDSGYHPGQFQNLVIPSRVVSGQFLITQVETFAEAGGDLLVRRVKAAKSLNNDADWRKVYRKWYGVGGSSSTSGTTSVVSDSGAGAGMGLHAQHHKLGGIDPLNVEELPASPGTDGYVLTRSGAGSVWAPVTGGGSPGGGSADPADIVLTDAYGSRPAAATEGRLFLPNNGFYIERDTGSIWAPWGPIFPMTPPVSGDFAWINQGGASVSTTNGGVYLLAPANAGVSMRIRKKAVPSTPYVITAAFLFAATSQDNNSFGLGWRQSSDGKLAAINYSAGSGSDLLRSTYYTDHNTVSSTVVNKLWKLRGVVWFRIAEDASNRTVSWSLDGQNFIQYHQVGRTTHITADEVMWFNDCNNADSIDCGLTLLSWKET